MQLIILEIFHLILCCWSIHLPIYCLQESHPNWRCLENLYRKACESDAKTQSRSSFTPSSFQISIKLRYLYKVNLATLQRSLMLAVCIHYLN